MMSPGDLSTEVYTADTDLFTAFMRAAWRDANQ